MTRERLTDDDVRHVIEMLEQADRWVFQDQTLSSLKELLALRARVAKLEAALLVDGTKLLARNARLEGALKHARGVIEAIMSDGNCDCRKDFAIIDAALKDKP